MRRPHVPRDPTFIFWPSWPCTLCRFGFMLRDHSFKQFFSTVRKGVTPGLWCATGICWDAVGVAIRVSKLVFNRRLVRCVAWRLQTSHKAEPDDAAQFLHPNRDLDGMQGSSTSTHGIRRYAKRSKLAIRSVKKLVEARILLLISRLDL